MKIILICIVLLSSTQYAFGDATLEFKEITSKGLITYKIKDEKLKFTQSTQERINLFNRNKLEFISFDPESGVSSVFNNDVLKQRVSQLTQQRLKKLSQVELKLEEKLKTMTPEQQEAGESLINILKYPDLYGEHTLLKINKSDTSKEINNITCQLYQVYRAKQLIKDFCMASAKSLKLSPEDYLTQRSFYAFNYNMQSQLMIAMGKTRFSLVDYDKHDIDGVLIESIDYRDSTIQQHLILNSISHDKVDKSEFTLPKTDLNTE
ncbi:MAG: hypothetical protein OQK98_04670 [Gammaproteobacteria bacterium]|nr:hypothetical protein [Gammaproteobacteria bacterium]